MSPIGDGFFAFKETFSVKKILTLKGIGTLRYSFILFLTFTAQFAKKVIVLNFVAFYRL